jgi:septal ring factor EnvC (AmiA/AmiB activator)
MDSKIDPKSSEDAFKLIKANRRDLVDLLTILSLKDRISDIDLNNRFEETIKTVDAQLHMYEETIEEQKTKISSLEQQLQELRGMFNEKFSS